MSEPAANAPVQGWMRKNKRRRNMFIFCGVSLLNVGILVLLWTQLLTPAPHSGLDPLIGQPAPNFSLAMLYPHSGKNALSLSNFKGKPIVLNFWASWCEPCKEEAPLLENTWKQMQAQRKDIVFLGIDFHESSSDATGFLQQYNITYPAALDTDGVVSSKYGIAGLPGTIFINRNGTVISKEPRELSAPVLSSNLQSIMQS